MTGAPLPVFKAKMVDHLAVGGSSYVFLNSSFSLGKVTGHTPDLAALLLHVPSREIPLFVSVRKAISFCPDQVVISVRLVLSSCT
jgi:hypothetical protein